MRTTLRLIAAMLAACVLASCVEDETVIDKASLARDGGQSTPSVTVAMLMSSPAEFTGSRVTLIGNVTAGLAFEFLDEQPFMLNDGTGGIWVMTTGAVPEAGAKATVRGVFRAPYQLKGRSYEAAVVVEPEGP